MPLLGQVLITLLVIGLICTYLTFRTRDWRFGLVAALLSLPIGVVAQDPYDLLLILPTLQLVATIALRWNAGPLCRLSLVLFGAAAWLISAAGPYLWHWPLAVSFVYLAIFCVGVAALIWQRPPWTALDSCPVGSSA